MSINNDVCPAPVYAMVCFMCHKGKSRSDPHVDCLDCHKSVCDLDSRYAVCKTLSPRQVEIYVRKSQEPSREMDRCETAVATTSTNTMYSMVTVAGTPRIVDNVDLQLNSFQVVPYIFLC